MNKSIVIGVLVGIVIFTVGSRMVPGPKCSDGTRSSSIGKRGACSHHGGVSASLWNIPLLIGSFFIGQKTHSVIARRKKKKPQEKYEVQKSPYGDIEKYANLLRSK